MADPATRVPELHKKPGSKSQMWNYFGLDTKRMESFRRRLQFVALVIEEWQPRMGTLVTCLHIFAFKGGYDEIIASNTRSVNFKEEAC